MGQPSAQRHGFEGLLGSSGHSWTEKGKRELIGEGDFRRIGHESENGVDDCGDLSHRSRSKNRYSHKPERKELDNSDGAIDGSEKSYVPKSSPRSSYGGDGWQEHSNRSSSWDETEPRAARNPGRYHRDAATFPMDQQDGATICLPEETNAYTGTSSEGFGRGEERTDSLMFLQNRLHVMDGASELVNSSQVLKGFGLGGDGSRFPRPSPTDMTDSTVMHGHSPSPGTSLETERGFQEGEEVDQALFNLHGHSMKQQGLASFEAGTSLEEADTRNRKRGFSSKSQWSRDLVDERSLVAVCGSHDEDWSERIAEPSSTFVHFANKGGSERDREAQWVSDNEGAQEADANVCQKLDLSKNLDIKEKGAKGVEGEKMGVENGGDSSCRDVDIAVVQPEDTPSEKMEESHVPGSPPYRIDGIEKEEGELLDEVLLEEELKDQNTVNLNEEQRAVHANMADEQATEDVLCALQNRNEDVCKRNSLAESLKLESQPSRDNLEPGKVQCEPSSSKIDAEDPRALDKEAGLVLRSSMDLQVQCTNSNLPLFQNAEIGESSKGKLTLELLFERTPVKDLSQEKLKDLKKELKLCLFTQPGEDARSYPDLERQTTGSQNMANDVRKKVGGFGGTQMRLNEQVLCVPVEGRNEPLNYGHKQKKMKLEALQLSLALPGTSRTQVGGNVALMEGHMEAERSFQSLTQTQMQTLSQTCTNSDGFTASLSLSQSQSFIHNPSCSLNYMSMDNAELSCGGSRQFSQGNNHNPHRNWPISEEQMSNAGHTVTSLSEDRSTHRRGIPLYQHILQSGNAQNNQVFPSVSARSHFPHRSHHLIPHRIQASLKILDATSQDVEGTQRQSGSGKGFPDRLHRQERQAVPDQQLCTREMQTDTHGAEERKRLEEYPASSNKRASRNYNIMGGSNQFNGKLELHEIATEAVSAMAQKLQELPDHFLGGLKGLANEILGVFEKREEFLNLQEKIRKRMDLTEDTLLLAHRTQLEILVALKTGMQAFVQVGIQQLTNSALIEIFLETKCRNVSCQLSLPVYGCDCRICLQRKGFCHECNCVLCFKFDTDTKSCRWVGCDFCMHWCHTDCGLRRSYIAPGPSVESGNEATEMQYRCVACDHHLELFGFVKQAFLKFAEGWDAEVLAKELDCVRRTFHGSEDMRGKQLCFKVEQMLQKLENKVGVGEVCRSMLRYFSEGNAELEGFCTGANKQPPPSKKRKETFDIMEATPKFRSLASKQVDEEKACIVFQSSDKVLETKRMEATGLEHDKARKKAEIEDIESVARIKHAESKMFEARVIEVRQEASGLQCIVSAKRAKIEEDYSGKYATLRLAEAEEKRGKRFEELQALERGQRDYQRMKMRMEGEIKDLLKKMEMRKRQFV